MILKVYCYRSTNEIESRYFMQNRSFFYRTRLALRLGETSITLDSFFGISGVNFVCFAKERLKNYLIESESEADSEKCLVSKFCGFEASVNR